MKRKIINSLLFIFIKIIPFSYYTPNFEKPLCEQYDYASVCVKNIIISKYLQSRGVELKGINPINFGGFPPFVDINISPNGKKVVIKDSLGRSLWDSATGKKIITLEQPIGWRPFFSKDIDITF